MINRFDFFKAEAGLILREARAEYVLFCFGEKLKEENNYTIQEDNRFSPIHVYLINKHHWTPTEVKSMSSKELRIALTEELKDFTLSKEQLSAWESCMY